MEKYRILYIDEQKQERENFEELADDELEILAKHPLTTQDEMLHFIWQDNFDAIIVDYGLMKDDPNVKYNGDDIVNRINDEREDFPALILTQDITQDDGVDEKVIATRVLSKDELDHNNVEPFKRKIKHYIKFYKNESAALRLEFSELNKLKADHGGSLGNEDLERFNYLDQKIERRLHGRKAFPSILKDSENLKSLKDMIQDADNFLKKKLSE